MYEAFCIFDARVIIQQLYILCWTQGKRYLEVTVYFVLLNILKNYILNIFYNADTLKRKILHLSAVVANDQFNDKKTLRSSKSTKSL